MTNGFCAYHPVINFLYFCGTIGIAMFVSHPTFTFFSLVFSIMYYGVLSRGKSRKWMAGYCLLFLMIVFFNGIMNPLGNTVVFRWINERAITWESLFYGATMGGNFISMLLWFACFNVVMTTDKLSHLFGKMMPSVALVMSMILRLIPTLQKKAKAIISARSCIGKGIKENDFRGKMDTGMEVLGILTSCALEDAVITADSMRSRGYVDQVHTSYQRYVWKKRDVIVGMILLVMACSTIFSVVSGGTAIQFFPEIKWEKANTLTYVGIINYAIFLSVPLIIESLEEITWHILKSRI